MTDLIVLLLLSFCVRTCSGVSECRLYMPARIPWLAGIHHLLYCILSYHLSRCGHYTEAGLGGKVSRIAYAHIHVCLSPTIIVRAREGYARVISL